MQIAGWFLHNFGADVGENGGAFPVLDLCQGDGEQDEVEGLPTGTVTYATGLTLAAAGLGSMLGQERAAISASNVLHHLLLPTTLADPGGATDNSPLPWSDGALACNLSTPGDRETFDRLLASLDNPAGLPAGSIAALAQEWRLPVVEYATRRDVGNVALRPVVSGVGWGTRGAESTQRLPTLSLGDPPDERSLAAQPPSPGPLAGVTVIDMTSMWAGPLSTSLLAGAGAEVIKVEPTCRPDGMRGTPKMFTILNKNKTVADLDLRHTGDRAKFVDLVARADIVIDSFSPRVMPNLGLTRPALVEAGGQSLLTLSMPAFPPGHRRSWIAYGTGIHAASGLGDLGDGRFAAPFVSYPDPIAGLTAFTTMLALLVGRRLGWRPRHTEVTILGATLPLLRFHAQQTADIPAAGVTTAGVTAA